MNAIIQTEGLTKQYGSHHAVDGISLHVEQGEIYGFLGLNGAGKTTTIRMLLGMIRPDSGASYLFGQRVDAGSHKLWANVGYMVETPYSYPELTVRENLEIIRRLRGIPERDAIDSVMDKLQLTAYRDRKAGKLSLGNGQRLGLAKAMLHNPKVLILDEPTNGLDPAGIVEVRQLLNELALTHGVTIFISSHILGEVARLATRIGIVHHGKLLQQGYKVKMSEEGLLLSDDHAIASPEQIAKLLVHANMPPIQLSVEEEDHRGGNLEASPVQAAMDITRCQHPAAGYAGARFFRIAGFSEQHREYIGCARVYG